MTKNKLFTFMVCLLFAAPIMAQQKLGDIVDFGGVKGMVFKVDNSGEHGLVMTIDKCKESWLKDKDAKFETGAFYEDDGEKNLAAIAKYIEEQNQQWEDFPYFNWCRSLGDGWYAPATDELKDILKAINGGEGKYNSKFMKKITKILKKHKGDGLINSGFGGTKAPHAMYSSTEGDAGMVYTIFFKESVVSMLVGGYSGPKGEFVVQSMPKTYTGGKFANAYGSRAVHKF